jgi:hypothetical protein
MVKIVFKNSFGILNHIFVKMKTVFKNMENYKKEGKYSYYEEGTPLVILHGLMGG